MSQVKLYHRKLNQANKAIKEYAESRTRPLVYHLYDQGYSTTDVADILNISRQAVQKMYPKEVTVECERCGAVLLQEEVMRKEGDPLNYCENCYDDLYTPWRSK